MKSRDNTTITIIGGGFCGMMTAVHLCRQAKHAVKIIIVNSGNPFGKGIAYSAYSSKHLLNVTAGKMSAYPDAPGHFVQWLKQKSSFAFIDEELLSKTYLPRQLYGEYLTHVWDEATKNKKPFVEVEIINDIATNIDSKDGKAIIHLEQSPEIKSDYVVIATGNALPRNPVIRNQSFFSTSKSYFRNPWRKESVSGLKSEKDILIIGNGLTMVDTVLGLIENGFTQKIYSVSPNGFSILSHRHNGTSYSGAVAEIKKPYHLPEIIGVVNKHIKIMRKLGVSAEPVIDSIRSITQEIWLSLSIAEKKIFLSRLRHLWGVARHRAAISIYDFIQRLRIKGQLIVNKGKILDIVETSNGIAVTIYNGKTKKEEMLLVERVINCTGPETDIANYDTALLKNLLGKGMVASDILKLGINADHTDGSIINADGQKSDTIFTLGTNLKGLLWESTAVPELRMQAEKLSRFILSKTEKGAPKRRTPAV